MNVLSLFDGMSCGRIALERAGFKVDKYYSSEIDKHAIKVTMANYPDTIQLGDVRNVKGDELGWIDLVAGGSPCQGFSFAGDMLAFDDPRSVLFFEFMRILNEARKVNPDVLFLLENVRMKKEHEQVITNVLGVRPIRLNSSLVSAQERKRLYWTNIPVNTIPKNRAITMRSILESNVDEKYHIREDLLNKISRHIDNDIAIVNIDGEFKSNQNKVGCLTAGGNSGGNHSDMDLLVYKKPTYGKPIQMSKSLESGGQQPFQQNRVYSSESRSPALLSQLSGGSHIIIDNYRVRRLTPIECERLQTMPDNYTNHVSDTQRYKMLGNGWTVDIVAHIFSHIPKQLPHQKP